jgi:hypothetical protein
MRLLRTTGITLPFSITKDPNSEVAHVITSHVKTPTVKVESFQVLRDEIFKKDKTNTEPKLILKRPEVNDSLPKVIFRTFSTHITPPSWARFFKNTNDESKISNMSRMLNESIMDDDDEEPEKDSLFYSEEFLFRPVLSGHILGGEGDVAVLGFEDIEDAKELASHWPESEVLTLDTEKAIIHADAMNLPFLLIKPALRGGNLKGGAPREAKIFGYI